MKIKLMLSLISLLIINLNASSQIAKLISDFKPAYISGKGIKYISDGEYLVSNLKPDDKAKGHRILILFKVLTGEEQDMPTTDFNNAIADVGLSTLFEKNINTDLSLISLKIGSYRSYLVFNQSKKSYKFTLKGLFKTATKTATNNFDGGIYGYHCRIVNYSTIPYFYTVSSVTEIPTIF